MMKLSKRELVGFFRKFPPNQATQYLGLRLACIGLPLLAGGCGFAPAPVDEFQGLGVTPTSSQQVNLGEIRQTKIALILSQNTRNLLGYENTQLVLYSQSPDWASAQEAIATEASNDPKLIAIGAVQILRKYFSSIKLEDSISTSEQDGFSNAVVFDATLEFPDPRNPLLTYLPSTYVRTYNLSFSFLSLGKTSVPLTTITGDFTEPCPYGAGIAQSSQCQISAEMGAFNLLDTHLAESF